MTDVPDLAERPRAPEREPPEQTTSGTRVTLRDVARAAGVSHTTVSNAFARPDQLSPELRDRILATARALGYAGPDPAARSLRTGRHGAYGLVFSEDLPFAFSDAAATSVFRGVAEACRDRRANLLLVATRSTRDAGDDQVDDPALGELAAGVPGLGHAAVDGVVVYSLASDSPMLGPVLARRLPLVVIDQPRLPGIGFVGIDDEGAAYEAAAHLVSLGHRRFVIASHKLRPDGQEGLASAERLAAATYEVTAARLAGDRRARREAGLDVERVPVVECARSDERRARNLLAPFFTDTRPDERPSAILAMSDRIARGAIAAIRRAGLAVPDDVSVVGFNDVGTASDDADGVGAEPALTTVRQPHAAKGRTAVELLSSAEPGETRILATELVVRESTAPPRE
jgi:DNA-binding LacI/PurR family transcriptional regulator